MLISLKGNKGNRESKKRTFPHFQSQSAITALCTPMRRVKNTYRPNDGLAFFWKRRNKDMCLFECFKGQNRIEKNNPWLWKKIFLILWDVMIALQVFTKVLFSSLCFPSSLSLKIKIVLFWSKNRHYLCHRDTVLSRQADTAPPVRFLHNLRKLLRPPLSFLSKMLCCP